MHGCVGRLQLSKCRLTLTAKSLNLLIAVSSLPQHLPTVCAVTDSRCACQAAVLCTLLLQQLKDTNTHRSIYVGISFNHKAQHTCWGVELGLVPLAAFAMLRYRQDSVTDSF